MSMNLEQFLEKLEHTPRDWYLAEKKRIRRPDFQCPVSAIPEYSCWNYINAAKQIGMSKKLAELIAAAADKRKMNGMPRGLRAKLLKACGL